MAQLSTVRPFFGAKRSGSEGRLLALAALAVPNVTFAPREGVQNMAEPSAVRPRRAHRPGSADII